MSEAPSRRLPRSLLFVPADDPRKLAKALMSGADLVILDLEDSVHLDAKDEARRLACEFLAAHSGQEARPQLYVRINDLHTRMSSTDLGAILPGRPDGIMLPKVNSGADISSLTGQMDQIAGEAAQNIGIISIVTETALALLQMQSFVGCDQRLIGLTWGAEDLATALGASASREADGSFTPPFALARTLCLITAAAAGIQAIDGIYGNFQDHAGLIRDAALASRDGFTAKMAIHPAQIPAINEAFTPSAEQIAEAKAIIAAFDVQRGRGVVALNGRMLDRPHFEQAKRILARAG